MFPFTKELMRLFCLTNSQSLLLHQPLTGKPCFKHGAIFVVNRNLSAAAFRHGLRDGKPDPVFAAVSFREYMEDKVTLKELEPGLYDRTFSGGRVNSVSREYSDYEACVQGYAAVTRLYAEPSAAPALDGIAFKV